MEFKDNLIFNTVNNGIIILDNDLNVLAWNKWLEIFTKIKEEDIVNKKFCTVFPYINEKKLQRKVKTVLVTNNPSFLSLNTNRYLIDIPVSNVTNMIFDSMQQDITILPYDIEKKYICIYVYDNTQMCEINKKLEKVNDDLVEMSHRDHLTQVYNRRYFAEQSRKIKLLSQRSTNSPFCLLTLDIDKFKKINDTYGHLFGDEVIIKVAQTIESQIRESDIVARFGGEEFVVLLQNCDLQCGFDVGEKIRKCIENTPITLHNDENIHCTVSVGVAQFSKKDNDNLEHTLSRADNALYEAKNKGRNQTITSD
jgi:diguanylate cyclase (GGDEF)-like protein